MKKNVRKLSTMDVQEPIEELSHQQTPSEESCTQQGAPKKVRGPTKMKAIWDMEGDYRIPVTVDESGQPVGSEGKELTSFLGTLVKSSQHVDIDCQDWRNFADNKKDDLWKIVKDRFSFFHVETKTIKNWVLADIGLKLKSWKYELKKSSFDPSLTVDEIVAAQNDSRVDKLQFKKLVTTWKNLKTQETSEMRKKTRSKSNEPHVTEPNLLPDLFTKSGTSVGIDWRNDDLAKVKGPEKGGRIRCLGKLIRVKDKGSSSSQDPQVPLLKARVNEL